jgi:predicted transcriptional regulator
MLSELPCIKEQLLNIANNLSEEDTWDDVLESVFTCRAVTRGFADVAAGHTIPHDQVKEYLAQRQREREASVE